MSEYNKKEVLYVCPDCRLSIKPKALEKKPIKCRTISDDGKACGGFATSRACPKCQYNTNPDQGPVGLIDTTIPQIALDTPNLPFSIVGVSHSGKTNYITVMLHELSKSPGLRLALGAQTTETRTYQNENYKRIYEDHTPTEGTEAGFSMPQIWFIKNLEKQKGGEVPTYTFTIFDGAGEDHETKLDPSSTVCRYIKTSKAIIITIDPLVLSKVRHGGVVDPDVMRNSLAGSEGETRNAGDIVHSVAEYIKAARGIKSIQTLDIPVAVVLTKFDTIINHKSFGQYATIKSPSMNIRDGKVDITDIKQVDEEIRNWLSEIGENAFINTLHSHFKEFYFFGVSSFGAPPKDARTLVENIRPHRVLDPILWLFKRAKFID
jgi:hypothetical protein